MQVEGCRLKNVTFVLGEMRDRERQREEEREKGLGSGGGWVAGTGLGTTVKNHDRKMTTARRGLCAFVCACTERDQQHV